MGATTPTKRTRPRGRTIGLFVGLGLAVALVLAFFVSPFASSKPDGLEKVAIDQGFDDTAKDHALADAPLADYGVEGVDDARRVDRSRRGHRCRPLLRARGRGVPGHQGAAVPAGVLAHTCAGHPLRLSAGWARATATAGLCTGRRPCTGSRPKPR